MEISIHAPHEGERPSVVCFGLNFSTFQSTLPTRGSDGDIEQITIVVLNISIHAPHEGERPDTTNAALAEQRISIHAPHEGERLQRRGQPQHGQHISIHAPHEGERRCLQCTHLTMTAFQSTLPTRGSDIRAVPYREGDMHFNPRSPRGGATPNRFIAYVSSPISIHAPHEGERLKTAIALKAQGVFQSTLPTRGSDYKWLIYRYDCGNFNPRSPRGGATVTRDKSLTIRSLFQSTLPTRGSD